MVTPVGAQHSVSVLFSLPADALPQLRSASSTGPVEVIAQDAGGADLGIGRLAVVDNRIDPRTGLIRFKPAFDNTSEVLRPGRAVNVRVLGYSAIGEIIP